MDCRLKIQAQLVPFSGSMATAQGYATTLALNKLFICLDEIGAKMKGFKGFSHITKNTGYILAKAESQKNLYAAY